MIELPGWFSVIRAILELLYFLSGIVIAVGAFLALGQIRLTKQIAKSNGRRESVRFASDLCKYFAETVVPAWADANGEYETNRLGFLTVAAPAGQAPFVVQNGEFVSHHFDLQRIAAEAPKAKLALKYLNVLEAFAIPFAEGVADENIGFRETARPFCQGAQLYMPFLFFLRSQNLGRFESIVKLYTIWTNRLAADAVAPLMQVMQQLAKGGEARIKPLDHGF